MKYKNIILIILAKYKFLSKLEMYSEIHYIINNVNNIN